MFDHVGPNVRDYARSRAFYEQALAPLGWTVLADGAFVLDPDGNNIEAVCHEAE